MTVNNNIKMNSSTSRRGTFLLIAGLMIAKQSVTTANAFQHDDYKEWLPGCEQSETFMDAALCVAKNSSPACFGYSTPKDLYQCFMQDWQNKNDNPDESTASDTEEPHKKNIMRDVLETAADCFDPYYDCMKEQVQTAVQALPQCLQDSSMALAQCFISNVGQCAPSCLNNDWDTPLFSDLSIWDLFNCRGINNNILQPMCDLLSCCSQCIPALEQVANCVVNDVLDFGFLTCEFDCEENPGRDRLLRAKMSDTTPDESNENENNSEYVITGTAQDVYSACVKIAPGLFTPKDAKGQLVARASFFECLVDKSVNLYTQVTPAPTTESPTAAPTETQQGTTSTVSPPQESNEDQDPNLIATPLSTEQATSTTSSSASPVALKGLIAVMTAFLAVVIA